jgi:hypothetical protein
MWCERDLERILAKKVNQGWRFGVGTAGAGGPRRDGIG